MGQERGILVVYLVLIVAIIGGAIAMVSATPSPVEIVVHPPEPTNTPAPSSTPPPITVYVTGAVALPQATLEVPYGSRVQDVIDAAGGLLENADLDRVNLAGIVRDGDQIHVFALEEATSDVVNGAEADAALPTASGGGIVYINTATLEELNTLPGIGPALAQRILDYRAEHGNFASFDDLDAVSGIGPALIEGLQGLVSFE